MGDEKIVSKQGVHFAFPVKDPVSGIVQQRRLRLDAVRDSKSQGQEMVTMAIPADGVNVKASYLEETIALLSDNTKSLDDRKAFLMGMILLARCR